jgi:Essential protein Yae1, N terminal
MDSPWDESDDNLKDVEWSRISSKFTNVSSLILLKRIFYDIVRRSQKAGYREGISAGKEAALQEGFDGGFADTGVPIGRELGILRGMSSAILALLRSSIAVNEKESIQADAQEISSQLSRIRFSDIMPRDLEAEEHARQHLEEDGVEIDVHEKIAATRDMEGIEDMLANLSAGTNITGTTRPSVDDVHILKGRLKVLSDRLNLQVDI